MRRAGFGNAARFDQQVVEAVLFGEIADFAQQIVAQRATDAAIGHFNELLFGARQVGAAVADQRGVDIDLAHIVDDDGYTQAVAVGQHMVEQRRLAGAKEAGQHGYGKSFHRCFLYVIPLRLTRL